MKEQIERLLNRLTTLLHMLLALQETEGTEEHQPTWVENIRQLLMTDLNACIAGDKFPDQVLIDLKNLPAPKAKASIAFLVNIFGEGHFASIIKMSHIASIITLVLGSGNKQALFGLVYSLYDWMGLHFNDRMNIDLKLFESAFGKYTGTEVVKVGNDQFVPISSPFYMGDLVIDQANVKRLAEFGQNLLTGATEDHVSEKPSASAKQNAFVE